MPSTGMPWTWTVPAEAGSRREGTDAPAGDPGGALGDDDDGAPSGAERGWVLVGGAIASGVSLAPGAFVVPSRHVAVAP